jgi:hypothetical protein
MAEITMEKSSDKGFDLTWLWALAAIASIGALMVWLMANRPEGTTVVTDDAEVAEVAVAEPTLVEAAAVSNAPADYVAQNVRIASLPVSASLGSRVFWSMPDGGNLLLVIAGPEVTDVSWATEGNTVSVTGSVQPVTEAYLSSLVAEQALLVDGLNQAATASHYLRVDRVNP